MTILAPIKRLLARCCGEGPSMDEVEVAIVGLKATMARKMYHPGPHEVSLYIPRLEITNKTTEGGRTSETTVVLNSLTIVSAPRSLVPGHPQGTPLKLSVRNG